MIEVRNWFSGCQSGRSRRSNTLQAHHNVKGLSLPPTLPATPPPPHKKVKPESLQMVTEAMKLKDTCSLEGKL